MQTNQNIERKEIVEEYNWDDCGWVDNYPMKKYSRKLRRRRIKAKFKKDIGEYF